MRTFADTSVSGSRTTSVARSSSGVGGRQSPLRARSDVLDDGRDRPALLLRVVDALGRREDHDRPVVQRVVERRAGEHEAVDQRDGHARLHARRQRPQGVVAGGPVEVQVIPDACVDHRDHRRASVDREPHVAHERLVENGVDHDPVVAPRSARRRSWVRSVGIR